VIRWEGLHTSIRKADRGADSDDGCFVFLVQDKAFSLPCVIGGDSGEEPRGTAIRTLLLAHGGVTM
jgi:hypothetical protein